jgi:rare lipoprotein A
VDVRINDRGPVKPERIIDLTYGAAKEIDMVRDGLVRVRVEVLEWGD